MGAETIGTLVGVAVIVAALAFYLITIALTLQKVSFELGTILIGVRAISDQCEPLGPVVRDIVNDVRAIDQDFEALLSDEPAPGRSPVPAGRR